MKDKLIGDSDMKGAETERLKPCPFCGRTEGVHLSRERDEPKMVWQYQVVCDFNFYGCGASGCFNEDPKKAIEAWNRRANDDRPN